MRRAALALVGLLAVLHVLANGLWLRADEGVQFTDAAYHYSQVLELRDGLFGDAADRARWAAGDDQQRYGEAWYYVAVAVAALSGPEPPRLIFGLSILLWPLLLFGVFRLGEELAPAGRSSQAGLLAAALAGLLPGLFNYSRVLVLDLPLAAAVAWAAVGLLSVLRAECEGRLTRRAWALALAATLVGLSIKANTAAFLVGPLWVAARPWLRRRWASDRIAVLRSAGAAAAGIAFLSAWMIWSHRADAILQTALDATWPGKALDYARSGSLAAWPGDWAQGAWSHSWEVAYFTTLQTFSPPALAAALAGCLWFFGRRRGCHDPLARAQRSLVFAWWIVPILGVTVLLEGLYDERYVLPLLPPVAAVAACAVLELPWRWPRRACAAALLVGGALNFAWISFDALPTTRPLLCGTVPGWAQSERVGDSLWLCAGYADYNFLDRPGEPTWADWPLGDLEQALFPARDALARPLRAVYLDRLYGLFYRALQRDLLRRDLLDADSMVLITHCADEAWMGAMFGSVEAVDAVIGEADVVFMRYGSAHTGDPAILGRRCAVFWNQRDNFEEGGALPLHDGTEVRWYLRAR